MPAPHENPTGEPWPVPYVGLLSEDLPAGFDPNSDEQFRALAMEDLLGAADQLHRVFSDVAETTSDLPYLLLGYPGEVDISKQAQPQDIAVARNIVREAIRRAFQNPAWGFTPDYLFGGESHGA